MGRIVWGQVIAWKWGEMNNVVRRVWAGLLRGLGGGGRNARPHAAAVPPAVSTPNEVNPVPPAHVAPVLRSAPPQRHVPLESAAVLDPVEPGILPQAEATEAELLEFMSADYNAVPADPEFKRKLREQLWNLVQRDELTRQ